MPSTSKVNHPLTITCNFKNTLPIPLTNIKFSVESLGLDNTKSWEQECVLVLMIDFVHGYTCAILLRGKLLGCYSKEVDTYCWWRAAEKVTLTSTLPTTDLLLLVSLVGGSSELPKRPCLNLCFFLLLRFSCWLSPVIYLYFPLPSFPSLGSHLLF